MEDKLTEEHWRLIQHLIPKQTGPGKPRSDTKYNMRPNKFYLDGRHVRS